MLAITVVECLLLGWLLSRQCGLLEVLNRTSALATMERKLLEISYRSAQRSVRRMMVSGVISWAGDQAMGYVSLL